MKKILVAAIFLASSMAFADHHEEKKGEKLEEHKARVMGKIDKRIAAMNEHKSCVSAATDKAAIKSCRAKMKETRGEWKKERKKKRGKKGM